MNKPLRSLMQTLLLAACALMLNPSGFAAAAQAQDAHCDNRTAQSAHANPQQKRRRVRRRARTTRRPVRRVRTENVNTTMAAPQTIGIIRGSTDVVPSNVYGAPNTDAPSTNGQPSTQRKPIMGGILNGKAISLPKPLYPAIAKAARASGTVVVQVIVDEEGKVISARAVSGHPLLQQASVQAAYGARFSPTQLSGQPVKVTGTISYNFVQ